VRNCVAVGANPARIAILDNFCWGNTERPETLGSLVRAAVGCHDVAIAYGTPFVSGKDSLNNEFRYEKAGQTETISIPPSLLITALGQIADIHQAVTMDLKEAGNVLLLIGQTRAEFGGSHYQLVTGDAREGEVPKVDLQRAPKVFAAVQEVISRGLVRSCHDLSEGGLAVALAEMAFAGGLGIDVDLGSFGEMDETVLLFSESNTRFVLEVPPEAADEAVSLIEQQTGLGVARLGEVRDSGRMRVAGTDGQPLIDEEIATLKECWQAPLRWKA
jgi:phosphoribosylformylglycinamidine synthase subunit PurSL